MNKSNIHILIGKTLSNVINIDNREIIFTTSEGVKYRLFHAQDCCEDVRVEEIFGDLSDLIDSPILQAEEAVNDENPGYYLLATLKGDQDQYDESFTWTFYKLATIKGSVTIRWLGESSGYYSESVDFGVIDDE